MQIHQYFTLWDWVVLFGYLGLTTFVGHAMRGKQGTIRDFFLGGRSLPWQAVTGSIIATEISGVTFIGVPGMLFALKGDFTYLQWGIGSVIGRILVAWFFVRVYYKKEIYSPYDYMGNQLGRATKTLATILFSLGSILGQSVRVLVAALPLRVVTGLPLTWCIIIIGLFAVGWTLMGGMRTVIWTDVMQFLLFTFGGILALFWIIGGLSGGWEEFWHMSEEFGRRRLWNLEFKADLQFTLWVALFAVPFQNLTAFGVDQLNAQRMFCCRDASAAKKALLGSCFGQLLTLLMMLVGAALFVHYHANPFSAPAREILHATDTMIAGSNVPVTGEHDLVFPLWIVTVLPVGLSGLILAGVFAAAISSLDSILAALSQTTLSLVYHPEQKTDAELKKLNLVFKSRLLVISWGILLTAFTLLLYYTKEQIPILSLAFGMTSYTMGPLLGIFLCALIGRASTRGLILGTSLSLLLVLFMRNDVWVLVLKIYPDLATLLAELPTYNLTLKEGVKGIVPTISYVWAWPVTTIITLLCGWLPKVLSSQKK